MGSRQKRLGESRNQEDQACVEQSWFSLWYLLHIQAPRLPIGDMAVVVNSLRGHLAKFDRGAQYLLQEGNSLHLRLFPLKAQAVLNAGAYNALPSGAMEECSRPRWSVCSAKSPNGAAWPTSPITKN
jgi:hypothetical protein